MNTDQLRTAPDNSGLTPEAMEKMREMIYRIELERAQLSPSRITIYFTDSKHND